ncbi:MAG: bifunctional precorrin-2 dehydrogenase/sirohydrochlorin ferrochelatase [Dysgonamonadaceae bacterium]
MKREDMNFLPISVNITNKRILIIGGGRVGYHKATILHRFTNEAFVISPEFHEGFDKLPFIRIQKTYDKSDLIGAFLVYVCTENKELNARVKADAEALGVMTSVCDDPELCDFVSPAIYKNDHITVAVSSNARDVYQSIDIRNQVHQLVQEGVIDLERRKIERKIY